jgi:hypothetical protein
VDDQGVWVCETGGGGTVGDFISRDADMARDPYKLNYGVTSEFPSAGFCQRRDDKCC